MLIFAEIQPADVYERVLAVERSMAFVMYLMSLVIALVCCQLVAKLAIFKLIANMVKEYLERTNRLLSIIEVHAQITDDQRDTVKNRIENVHDAVEKVPDKTADKLKDVIQPSNGPKPLSMWPFATSMVLIATGITGANMTSTNPSPQSTPTANDVAINESIQGCNGAEMYEQAMSYMRNREYAKACNLFANARNFGPELRRYATEKAAECHFYLGEHDKALALCGDLTTFVPKCGRAYLIRGLVYEARGETDLALRHWYTAAVYGDSIAQNKIKTRRAI